MPNHAVALKVTPCLSIECKFWLDDQGWNGRAEELGIAIQAESFAQAKADMELALGKHLESLLHNNGASRERTASAA
jgi:predicted RNase H-like HicB family nuclease